MQYIFINEQQLKDLEKANATGGSAILDLEYDIDKHCNKIVEHGEEIKFVIQVTTVVTEDGMEAEDKIYYTGRLVGKDGNTIIVKDVMIGRDGPPPKEEPLKNFGDVVKQEKKEAVNHPSHYQLGDLGIEALDVMEATMTKEQLKGFYIGNVQKYTLRAAEKNGLEDFKKALFYLNKLVELMEGE